MVNSHRPTPFDRRRRQSFPHLDEPECRRFTDPTTAVNAHTLVFHIIRVTIERPRIFGTTCCAHYYFLTLPFSAVRCRTQRRCSLLGFSPSPVDAQSRFEINSLNRVIIIINFFRVSTGTDNPRARIIFRVHTRGKQNNNVAHVSEW